MRTKGTHPNTHLAGTLNEADEAWEHWEDEAPAVSPAQLQKRLFKVLGWAGVGFAAVAGVSLALAGQVSGIALFGGLIAAGLGVVGFIATFAVASQIAHHSGAHMLLWTATVFYAVIINLFCASFGIEPLIVAGAVAATGAAVLVILAAGVAAGFNALAMCARWVTYIAAAIGTLYAIDPELWWVGLIAGFLLAITVEMTLGAALERPHVPEPALAACLVAGVTAIVILVLYAIIRFGIRIAAGAVVIGAQAARP